jgi:hypothetical protein
MVLQNVNVENNQDYGVFASGAGTQMVLQNVNVENNQNRGVDVRYGAQLVATECHFHQNGVSGVYVESTTTARLTNCTSHHNKDHGVYADNGAVVDLMGKQTSVHDNERFGLYAGSGGSTINVYQPCVLNDMSHGNKDQNIKEAYSGRVQQKDSKRI